MTVNIPHGPQPDPLDDLLADLMVEHAKGELFVEKISTYSDPQGMSYVVTFRMIPTPNTTAPAKRQSTGIRYHPSVQPSVQPSSNEGAIKHLGTTKEVFTGYRDFDLVSLHDGYILTSRNNAYWRPRKKMVAYCTHKGLAADHDAPGEHCDCGIYAFDRPDHPDLIAQNKIWGEIAMWGEILICEEGYRAEYAYPTNLFLRDTGTKGVRHVASELEQTYGVPVFLVPERQGKTAAEIMMEMLENTDLLTMPEGPYFID